MFFFFFFFFFFLHDYVMICHDTYFAFSSESWSFFFFFNSLKWWLGLLFGLRMDSLRSFELRTTYFFQSLCATCNIKRPEFTGFVSKKANKKSTVFGRFECIQPRCRWNAAKNQCLHLKTVADANAFESTWPGWLPRNGWVASKIRHSSTFR